MPLTSASMQGAIFTPTQQKYSLLVVLSLALHCQQNAEGGCKCKLQVAKLCHDGSRRWAGAASSARGGPSPPARQAAGAPSGGRSPTTHIAKPIPQTPTDATNTPSSICALLHLSCLQGDDRGVEQVPHKHHQFDS